jgi:murein DD-endopeptidase MepM/ murein hydrolase activator NlpD
VTSRAGIGARWRRRSRRFATLIGAILAVGLVWPASQTIPVEGATVADWNRDTFWHHPWGRSGVHKGIDIFAKEGTPVLAATGGVVLYGGTLELGGNVLIVLGPKWRLHYYAHLNVRLPIAGDRVRQGETIGFVGTTGNAAGKPAHLHYSIVTLVPYPWRVRLQPQGWKRAWYLDPDAVLRRSAET